MITSKKTLPPLITLLIYQDHQNEAKIGIEIIILMTIITINQETGQETTIEEIEAEVIAGEVVDQGIKTSAIMGMGKGTEIMIIVVINITLGIIVGI